MKILAASGDTWGIPGLTFLGGYVVLAVLVVGLTVLLRRSLVAQAGRDRPHPTELDPFAFALLSGGPQRVVQAALAGLRTRQLIAAAPGGGIVVTGPPAGLHPVEFAVYQAIAAGRNRVLTITVDRGFRDAVAPIAHHLEWAGLVLDLQERRSFRRLGLLFLPVFLLGLVRLWAGTSAGKPVGFLSTVLIILFFVQLLLPFISPPGQTKAGAALVEQHTQRYDHLQPSFSPSWGAYGALGAAMGVAVFGTAAFVAADPAFAAEVQLREHLSGSSGSSSSGDGASSCSGGSSCGGGGCGG